MIMPFDTTLSVATSLDPDAMLAWKYALTIPPIDTDSFSDYIRRLSHFITASDSGYKTFKQRELNLPQGKSVTITATEMATILSRVFILRNVHPDTTLSLRNIENDPSCKLRVYIPFPDVPQYGLYIQPGPLLEMAIEQFDPSGTTDRKVREVINKLTRTVTHVTETDHTHDVIVGNGVYHKQTHKFEFFQPELVYTSKVQTPYVPVAFEPVLQNPDDGTDWRFTEWLDELADHDPQRVKLFWQVIAAAIQPGKAYNKAIMFYSRAGNNGKGTYGQLIKNIVGENNYSSLSIPQYGQKYMTGLLVDKVVNICDENPTGIYIDNIAQFKAVITGDTILIEEKFERPFSTQINQLSIQMINEFPKFKDKSNSFYRRVIVVPFFHTFTGSEKKWIKTDFMYDNRIKQYVLAKALEMDEFDTFVEPDVSGDALYDMQMDNNSVFEFWDEMDEEFQWDFLPLRFAYQVYTQWMLKYNNRGTVFGKKQFNTYSKDWMDLSQTWIYPSNNNKQPVNGRMDKDEPLITEYNLTDYMDKTASAKDPTAQRNFTRPTRDRGYERVPHKP